MLSLNIDEYDLFVKIDDDDIYKKNYIKVSNFYPIIYNNNQVVVRRTDISLPWYTKYRYFFSDANQVITNLFLGSSFNAYNIKDLYQKNTELMNNWFKEKLR